MDGLTMDQIGWPTALASAAFFTVIYVILVIVERRNRPNKMKK